MGKKIKTIHYLTKASYLYGFWIFAPYLPISIRQTQVWSKINLAAAAAMGSVLNIKPLPITRRQNRCLPKRERNQELQKKFLKAMQERVTHFKSQG